MDARTEVYTWVSGHWRRVAPSGSGSWPIITIRIVPSQPATFPIQCRYCNGFGKDGGRIDMQEHDCPACKGTGWLTLPGVLDNYKPCGHCQQNPGKEQGLPENPLFRLSSPCHVCLGSGLTRVP